MNQRLTTSIAALALAVSGVAAAQEQATVLKRDGSYDLMHREECEQRDDLQLVEKHGRPYFFRQI